MTLRSAFGRNLDNSLPDGARVMRIRAIRLGSAKWAESGTAWETLIP